MTVVNRSECNFFSLELRLSGSAPIVGFNKLEYSFKVGAEHVKGASRVPLGTTIGRIDEQTGNITVLLSTYRSLTAVRGWMGQKYTLVLVFSLAGAVQQRVVLRGVVFTDNKFATEDKPDALTRDLSFKFERVFEDGFCPVTGEAESGAAT